MEGALWRWDGNTWENVRDLVELPGWINVLRVIDDGRGPALYIASGRFFVRWDGTSVTRLSAAPECIGALAAYDYGSGPIFYTNGSSNRAIAASRWE